MSNKPDIKQEKPKEYQVSNYDMSELSFVAMMLRGKEEELAFFSERLRFLKNDVAKRLGINPTNEVDWTKVYTTGKIFARKPLQQPEAQVEVKENAEPKLQPEQEQGVPSTS